MAAFSALALVVTIWGLILIGKTLAATQEAAGYAAETLGQAKDATIAANETVKVTRDMGVAQTRAYITIKDAELMIPIHGWPKHTNGGFQFAISAIFENSGNTPAYNVASQVKIRIMKNKSTILDVPFGNLLRFSVLTHKSESERPKSYMQADTPLNGVTAPLSDKGVNVSVTVKTTYEDVFENKYLIETSFFGICSMAVVKKNYTWKDLRLMHAAGSDKRLKIKSAT